MICSIIFENRVESFELNFNFATLNQVRVGKRFEAMVPSSERISNHLMRVFKIVAPFKIVATLKNWVKIFRLVIGLSCASPTILKKKGEKGRRIERKRVKKGGKGRKRKYHPQKKSENGPTPEKGWKRNSQKIEIEEKWHHQKFAFVEHKLRVYPLKKREKKGRKDKKNLQMVLSVFNFRHLRWLVYSTKDINLDPLPRGVRADEKNEKKWNERKWEKIWSIFENNVVDKLQIADEECKGAKKYNNKGKNVRWESYFCQ